MSVLNRKPSWQQQLRQTKAKEWLLSGHLDKFPIAEIQKIGDRVLKDKSPLLRKIAPRSEECDVLFANELLSVKGELGTHESAILSCLHLLSYAQARGQVLSIKPDPVQVDLFFERRLNIYLQCIIHSRRANPDVCSEEETSAARDCLGVSQGRTKDFPSILRLLEAVGYETCEAVLPLGLIKKVLTVSHYQENLTRELNTLKNARQWFDAYKLVYSLRNIVGLPRADQMLRDTFPDYPMWAAWRPDTKRIMSWESPNLAPYRSQLLAALDLEGPDTTGQQRGTLRMSSPGAFTGLSEPTHSTDRHILDRLLDVLDSSLAIGLATVDLLIALCVEREDVSERTLSQLEAAVSVNNDAASKVLANLVRVLSPSTKPITRMSAFASAVHILTQYPALRVPFGVFLDLGHRASGAFTAGQDLLSQCLTENNPDIEPVCSSVLKLGHALLSADWLHGQWQLDFIKFLRQLPTEDEIRPSYQSIQSQGGPSTNMAVQVGFLATRVGGAQVVISGAVAELARSEALAVNNETKGLRTSWKEAAEAIS
ncbi:hypothetical protein B0T14DRAFT_567212 [Immersiella caudata]|uniref:Uncharacterized protein n=1 Tax=Immersiella caudata TaxID=314043 RepID=A0AA39TL99_9PEZI|nr:hypothetical protein B0T14DRAFT_572195 [Immersiella caudata]KAK0620469.1 hypothetical protein B0T14DRAFT_567212 [Immersiella caudata]